MRDDRFDAGLKCKFGGFVMFKMYDFRAFTTPGIKIITKPGVALQALQCHSPSSHGWPLCLRLHKLNYSVNITGRAGLFCTKPKLAAEVLIRVANLT
jgi:hypothetical protein